MNYSALFEKILSLLERLLVYITIRNEVKLTEKAKVVLKSSEEVLKTNTQLKKVKSDVEKLSKEDLDNLTVID